MDKDYEKFKALVHYIIHACRECYAHLGSIRLNKAVWYSDVIAYKICGGQSITGSRYIRRKKGPVPERILEALSEFETAGIVKIEEPQFPYDTRKFICLSEPKDDLLSSDDKKIVEFALRSVLQRTANEISDGTHTLSWVVAEEGEEIPLYATLAETPGEITPEIVSRIKQELQHV